jgi:glycosyltransferase involved in cell wall biosynthesis
MTAAHRVLEVVGMTAGGIGSHVADISQALGAEPDIDIDIAAPPDLQVRMPTDVIPVLIPTGLVGHRRTVRTLQEVISAGSYGVVHAHGLRAAIDATRAAESSTATTVATIHNLVLPEISGTLRSMLYRRGEALAVRWNDHVFAPSADIAQRLAQAAPRHASKVEVLHLGVPPPPTPRNREEVRAELGLESRQQLLVTVARLAPQKALDVLLKAVELLPEPVHLALIGSGPLESRLKGLASGPGLAERVSFLGHLASPQDQVAAADIFCLSSAWEACSLAAQEAIRLGVPVVSTDVGGMPELIQDRISGRLVPAGDARALAGAVADLLAAPDERRRLAANALAHLDQHFSRSTMLDRLAAAYRGRWIAVS